MKKNIIFFIALFGIFLFSNSAQAKQLTIIYTGETHATLFPCHCPAEPAGGVSRRATKIKQLRKDDPDLLLLETGSPFSGGIQDYNKQSDELDKQRTYVYLFSLKLMGYDAVGIGQDALIYGREFLDEMSKKTGAEFLSLNIPGVESHIIKNISGLKVAVIGFGGFNQACNECPGIIGLRNLIQKLKKDGANIIIVLSDQDLEQNFSIVKQVVGIDCLITSNTATNNQNPVLEIGNTLVALSYWQGRRLSRLDLDIENGKIKSFNHSEIKLTPEVADDPGVANLLNKYPNFKR